MAISSKYYKVIFKTWSS